MSPAVRQIHPEPRWPWFVLGLLLGACLAHGLWVVRDLGLYTAILDTYRDAGFVQGILDGNLAGDPSIEGARRYYPPMIHVLAAAAALASRMQPLPLLIKIAPWLNLLIPAAFFLMARRLVNSAAAAVATTVLVCFDGILLPPWMIASYSPWHSVPEITQALFFCGVWLVCERSGSGRLRDALWIGSIVGLVFLAHTVPALILAAIAAAAAFSAHGLRLRTLTWVGTAAATAALWAAPFLIPLITAYHLKIVNAAGSFTDPLFDPAHIPKRVILACLPGLAALGLLGWNFRGCRTRHPLPRPAAAILGVWIGLPLLFMARHFGCAGSESALCTAFQVPVHHWMIYLQSALACVFGHATVSLLPVGSDRAPRPGSAPLVATSAIAAVVMVCALLFLQPMDRQMRARAMDMRNRIDLKLYGWLLSSTRPNALFVTDVSTDAVHDSAAVAVLAAGRKSAALPFTYSNPYIDWRERKERDDLYLAAIRSGADAPALCRLLTEAGPGNAVYVALEPGTAIGSTRLQRVFHSNQNDLYAIPSDSCR